MREPLDPSVIATLDKNRSSTERMAVVDGDLWIDFGGKAERDASALRTHHQTSRRWHVAQLEHGARIGRDDWVLKSLLLY